MKSSWVRKLAVSLALGCAGTQIAPGSILLASALTLGLHTGEHAHSGSVVADEGHLHLVLSHHERGGEDSGDARHHDDPVTSTSERDHVFHLADDDAANTTSRRVGLAAAPVATIAVALLPAPTLRPLPRPAPEPRARSSDLLRTVVLRF